LFLLICAARNGSDPRSRLPLPALRRAFCPHSAPSRA
jgi:hypothetical protein